MVYQLLVSVYKEGGNEWFITVISVRIYGWGEGMNFLLEFICKEGGNKWFI